MAEVRVEWDEARIAGLLSPTRNYSVAAALDRVAARLVVEMKREAPVSKPGPVYAVEAARQQGKRHRQDKVSSPTRFVGDFPLRPSGYLRSSIHAFRQSDGSVIVGPTAKYAGYVIHGTPPHEIRSHGHWPLRNRATGQVFGPVVHHPGTLPNDFVARALHRIAGIPV